MPDHRDWFALVISASIESDIAQRIRLYGDVAGSEGPIVNHEKHETGPMHKRQQFSTFQSYLKDRERKIKRLLSAMEKRGVEGGRSIDVRLLVDQINRDLRGKKFGHFVNDVPSLADFQVSIERAASLLDGIAAYGENQRPVACWFPLSARKFDPLLLAHLDSERADWAEGFSLPFRTLA